jgi:glycosyltransferase involved in cell wall biosynthesis
LPNQKALSKLVRRNVLQLVGSFHQGGSERQAIQLIRLLHASGRYRVRVATLNPQGVLREEVEPLELGAIPEYPLNSFYDRNAIAQLRRFTSFLREQKIDLVQTHDFYTNVFGLTAAAFAGVPARVAAKRETGGLRSPTQRRVELIAYRLAHAIVVNAEAVRQQLVSEGVPERKIATVYNGLDAARVSPPDGFRSEDALKFFALPSGRRFVTLVANLRHAVKDHPTFLRAASRIKSVAPDAAFVIAGEGELLEPMRAMAAELGLSDDVFFIGRCENISELLAISEVCVLSSLAEGFSNAILEYMAAGRPVVATDVGGAREAIDEGATGFVVAPQDHFGMAERIALLLNDSERARTMGERGRAVVQEQFSPEAQLRKTELLYERLLSGEKTETVSEGKLFPTRS